MCLPLLMEAISDCDKYTTRTSTRRRRRSYEWMSIWDERRCGFNLRVWEWKRRPRRCQTTIPVEARRPHWHMWSDRVRAREWRRNSEGAVADQLKVKLKRDGGRRRRRREDADPPMNATWALSRGISPKHQHQPSHPPTHQALPPLPNPMPLQKPQSHSK